MLARRVGRVSHASAPWSSQDECAFSLWPSLTQFFAAIRRTDIRLPVPTSEPMMIERRTERSSIPWEAASLYLKSMVARKQLDHMVLASREGMFVLGSEGSERDSRLAALAPLVAEHPSALSPRVVARVTRGRPIQTWRVRVRGQPCFLAAVGRSTQLTTDVQHTLDRIFSTGRTPGPSRPMLPN